MEKIFELEMLLEQCQGKDKEFEEYIDKKCLKALTECREYIEKEYSQKCDEDDLNVMRERLIFKTAWVAGFNFANSYNKI
jgi:hypothetical protein